MKRPPADPVPWTPPDEADGDGLVGVGGDLDPAILLRAYADGVFPWFNEGDPILWWSPDPRAVIELDGLHVSKSLTRTMRKGHFRVTLDRRFETVMRQCGERRDEGTWVTEGMVKSYAELHRLGHAHSLETWVREFEPVLGFNAITGSPAARAAPARPTWRPASRSPIPR